MGFHTNYSDVRAVCFTNSFECFDILDFFTHKMRDEHQRGLFGYHYDTQRDKEFFTFYDFSMEFEMGAYIFYDDEKDFIYIEDNNRLYAFNLKHIQQTIEGRKRQCIR